MIHRAPLGSHERFIGFLIEHYAGALPPWLASVQARIIPIGREHEAYAHTLAQGITDRGHQAEVHPAGGTVAHAVRIAEEAKVPFIAVVGDRETRSHSVTIRARGGHQLGTMPAETFLDRLDRTVATKTMAAELAS